jgi:outer membrane protein assembly factor BamD
MKQWGIPELCRSSHLKWWLIIGGMFLLLTGCSLFKSEASKELDRSPESLISEGLEYYQRKKYKRAIESFQKLKDRFPYHQYAIVAEIKLADSYYLNKEYELAAVTYREFEKMHPANEIIPYVIFQMAMCSFHQMPTIDRDQSFTQKALQDFERLVKNFPKSEYAAQAKINIVSAKKHLVSHEFYIGEFYMKGKKYDAALGRFETILTQYPDVPPPPKIKENIQTCKDRLADQKQEKDKTPWKLFPLKLPL